MLPHLAPNRKPVKYIVTLTPVGKLLQSSFVKLLVWERQKPCRININSNTEIKGRNVYKIKVRDMAS